MIIFGALVAVAVAAVIARRIWGSRVVTPARLVERALHRSNNGNRVDLIYPGGANPRGARRLNEVEGLMQARGYSLAEEIVVPNRFGWVKQTYRRQPNS